MFSAWPGTSPGSPTSVMTEDQWLGVTSCGSPGSEMCHHSADRLEPCCLLGVFAVCRQRSEWLGGCPSLRARSRLQEHYLHLIVSVQRSLTEILEAPQVSSALRPWPGRTHRDSLVSLYLFLSLVYMCMCVHSLDPKLTPPSHPCGHLPPPGSHTHYQSPLMASN